MALHLGVRGCVSVKTLGKETSKFSTTAMGLKSLLFREIKFLCVVENTL